MKRVRERVLESGRQVEARALFAWKGVVGVERLHGHTGRWLLERLIVRTARRVLEGWRQWTWAQVRLGHAGLMVMRMRMRRQARRTLVGWAGARKSKGGDKDSEKEGWERAYDACCWGFRVGIRGRTSRRVVEGWRGVARRQREMEVLCEREERKRRKRNRLSVMSGWREAVRRARKARRGVERMSGRRARLRAVEAMREWSEVTWTSRALNLGEEEHAVARSRRRVKALWEEWRDGARRRRAVTRVVKRMRWRRRVGVLQRMLCEWRAVPLAERERAGESERESLDVMVEDRKSVV